MTFNSEKYSNWIMVILVAMSLIGNIFSAAVIGLSKWNSTDNSVTSLTQQYVEMRTSMNQGFHDVQLQIQSLPVQQAALDELVHRANDAATHLSALDARSTASEQMIYQDHSQIQSIRSDLDTMKRASEAPVRAPR